MHEHEPNVGAPRYTLQITKICVEPVFYKYVMDDDDDEDCDDNNKLVYPAQFLGDTCDLIL